MARQSDKAKIDLLERNFLILLNSETSFTPEKVFSLAKSSMFAVLKVNQSYLRNSNLIEFDQDQKPKLRLRS